MTPGDRLNDEQRRLLRVVGRMPLASATDLAAALGHTEHWTREMLNALRRGEWVEMVRRGVVERARQRWFLTRRAIELLYNLDHQHPSSREEARAMASPAQSEMDELRERFALDHRHAPHLEGQDSSPFVAHRPVAITADGPAHQHPPWTATERGVETSLRRLAMLEPLYSLAPDLLSSGRARWPTGNISQNLRMTDFRLLRHGGFYHAVARYGDEVWAPFTYAGLHATERILRRKEQHRYWGVNCYSHRDDRYRHIGNQVFYEDPDLEVEPSLQVVVAADAWAAELARRALTGTTPTVFCTADGQCSEAVELRPSRDLVADGVGHPAVGRPERLGRWLGRHPDVAAIDGRSVGPAADLEHHSGRNVQVQSEAVLRLRRIVSTNAVAIVNTDTEPMVKGAVIMPVSTQASGGTPAMTTLKTRRTMATTD